MSFIFESFKEAVLLVTSMDRAFLDAVLVSLTVAVASTFLASLLGVPCGIVLARKKFFGARSLLTVINTLMSMPTVLVGLLVFSFLSRQGPLGGLDMLFTRSAIVIGQFILALPIVTGLTISAIKGMDSRVELTAMSLGATGGQAWILFLGEARFGIMAAVIAGFGRVFAEVGVSMMLGGNIPGYTRTITTSIALETSKGEFGLGIALGMFLLIIALAVNITFSLLQKKPGN